MNGNFYSETYTYRDGRILLYKRPNSKNFQCRLRVEGIKGYIIQSCKTPNLGNAVKYAEDTYDNLRFKKLNNLPLKTKTFRQIFNDWFARADKSEYRKDFYISRAKLYLFPYFGNYNIDEITETIIDDYWLWRKNYYKDNPEKLKGNAADIPSAQSLKMEKTAIKEVMEYAHRRGYIRAVPQINFKPRAKTQNRDTFSKDEYDYLCEGAFLWSTQKAKASDVYQRKMLYNLIIFLANTGIRPNEYYKIKWKDIFIHEQNGVKILYIYISDNTKTGHRIVVSLPQAYTSYNNIKSFSKYKGQNDFFFSNYDGTWMKNCSKTYITLLKTLNLYISSDGKTRPVYSLRHYYATQRLLDGVQVYDLAQNMGTSVKQIENHYGHILSVQKTDELIQGASISESQKNEEFKQVFGVESPKEYVMKNSQNISTKDKDINDVIENMMQRSEEYVNKVIKNPEDAKKFWEMMKKNTKK